MRHTLQLLFVTLIILSVVMFSPGRMYAESATIATNGEQVYIPKDLDDCIIQLLDLLSPEDIEAIKSSTEDDLCLYHFGLGTWLRNSWELWGGSRLSLWFNSIGIYHPDDMSGIILLSFWRYLHDMPLDLDEQVEQIKNYWEAAQNEFEALLTKHAKEQIASMMLNLTLVYTQPQTLDLPMRLNDSMLKASFMAPYRNGILIVANKGDNEAPQATGFFYDSQKRELQLVVVPEMEQVQSIVVVDNTAWFAGQRDDGKAALLAVSETQRNWVELPHSEVIPQLGISGDNLLAIYSNTVYQWDDTKWKTLYSGDLAVPKMTPPPRICADYLIYFNDGPYNLYRELQLLNLRSGLLTSVQKELGVIRPEGPRWETAVSYTLTDTGNLWVTFRNFDHGSLVKRNADGTYGIAIINNGVQFDGHHLHSTETDLGLSVSAIRVQNENQITFFGDHGLNKYNPTDGVITQLLTFENTTQKIPVVVLGHNTVYHWTWIPCEVAATAEGDFVIAGYYGGIYLLKQDTFGLYQIFVLDENINSVIYI